MEDCQEGDSFQFHPATVEKLIQLVIDINPRENRRNAWKKIAYRLSSLQEGVTVKRCSQKWRNLVNQCRTYTQLLKWAEIHNFKHSRPPPEHYQQIMPFLAVWDLKKAPSQDHISIQMSSEDELENDDDDNNECDDECEGSPAAVTEPEESEEISTVDAPEGHASPIRVSVNALDSWKSVVVEEDERTDSRVEERELDTSSPIDIKPPADILALQGSHISRLEKKLDNALALLADLSRENQRLSKVVETQSVFKVESIVKKVTNIAEVQSEANIYFGKQLETLMKMLERHHQDHLKAMAQLSHCLEAGRIEKADGTDPKCSVSDKKVIIVKEAPSKNSVPIKQSVQSPTKQQVTVITPVINSKSVNSGKTPVIECKSRLIKTPGRVDTSHAKIISPVKLDIPQSEASPDSVGTLKGKTTFKVLTKSLPLDQPQKEALEKTGGSKAIQEAEDRQGVSSSEKGHLLAAQNISKTEADDRITKPTVRVKREGIPEDTVMRITAKRRRMIANIKSLAR